MPIRSAARTARPIRRRRAAATAALAILGLLVAGGAATAGASPRVPDPAPTKAATRSPKVAATVDPRVGDLSGTMPVAVRDEAITQIGSGRLGRTRVEGNANGAQLNTYESPDEGGGLIYSPTVDLGLPWPVAPGDPFIHDPEYNGWVDTDTLAGKGLLAAVAEWFHIKTIYAAADQQGGGLIVSGITGTDSNSFRNWVYLLDGPGPCNQPPSTPAGSLCIQNKVVINGPAATGQPVVTTSLASFGEVGRGGAYMAVGLSDGTVKIIDGNLTTVGTFTVPTGACCQAPVTALAWDPSGSGKLAVGTMTKGSAGYVITVNENGSVAPTYATWDQVGTDNLVTVPLSVAWGKDANGTSIIGYGVNNARLMLVDPTSGTTTATYTYTNVTGAATNVTAVPRVDGTSGGDDWAVTVQPGTDALTAYGTLIRFTATTGAEQTLRPASGSDNGTLLGSLDEYRSWFPGYKLGVVGFGPTLADEPLDISLYARPEAGYGCWFSPQVAPPPFQPHLPPLVPFPTDVTLPVDGLDEGFVVGALTSGSQGKCNAGDETSTRRGYIVLTPTSTQQTATGPVSTRPDDALIVNLTLNDNPPTYDLSDTSGGPISLTTASVPSAYHPGPGPYPQLDVTAEEPAQPTPAGAPTIVNAVQLNNLSVRGRTPVYRIDVGPMSWNVPGAGAGQRQALLQPLQVQGSVDGVHYSTLGEFMPVAPLNQSATAANGNAVVTSGNAGTKNPSGSFFWENAGGSAYTTLRVVAGTLTSKPITLATLPNPATPTIFPASISVGPAKINVTTASVVANGVDQAPLLVKISGNGSVLPSSDPAYGLVYYRDTSGDLITNLYSPKDYDDFVGVQPSAGAYPNNGSNSSAAGAARRAGRPGVGSSAPAYDYVSTAYSGTKNLVAYVGTAAPTTVANLNVQGGTFAPTQTDGKAVPGVGFTGCSDFQSGDSCQMATVVAGSRPALYQAGDATVGPVLGAQLQMVARNSLSDLPLQYTAGVTQTKLATAGVVIANSGALAKITTADKNNFTPTQNVDFSVISHGQLLSLSTVPVGGN